MYFPTHFTSIPKHHQTKCKNVDVEKAQSKPEMSMCRMDHGIDKELNDMVP
jgi:hypothetical protein